MRYEAIDGHPVERRDRFLAPKSRSAVSSFLELGRFFRVPTATLLHLPSSLFFRNFFLQCSTLHSYTRHIPPPLHLPAPSLHDDAGSRQRGRRGGGSPRSSLKGDENSRIGGRTFAPSAAKIKGASCEEEGGDAAQVCGVSYMGELALKHCFYRGKCEKVLQFHVSVSFSDFRKPTFLGPRALACGCNCRFSRRLHPFHDGSYHPIPRLPLLPLLRSDRRNPCNFTSLQLRLRRLRRSEPSSPPPSPLGQRIAA